MQLPKYIQKVENELWLTENERENLKIDYRIKDIIFAQNSKFQHVMILDSYDFDRMLVLDGVVQTTSIDGYIYNEMISHVPLNFHPNPKKVLIIGGGDCGVARETAKYEEVEEIDMVEIDELVVAVSKKHLPEVSGNLSDSRVNFIYNDGVEFVKNKTNHYDIVIIDSSDPIGPAKQLFELSFYKDVYQSLKEDGLMVCQSQSPIFHSEILEKTFNHIKTLFNTTKLYTAVVPTYPGGLWSFTLGSKKYTDFFIKPFDDKNTKYVNEEILKRAFSIPQFVKNNLKLK